MPRLRSRSAALALLALAAACGPAPAAPESPAAVASTPPPPQASPPASPGPTGGDPLPGLRAVICADRAPCEIRRERAAGIDAAGRRLSVVSVYAGRERWDEGEEEDAKKPDGSAGGAAGAQDIGLSEGEREDTTSPTFGGCHHIEYWLVTRRGEAIDAAVALLRLCNDGHGASGVGEDTVTIGDNALRYTTVGGSAWRWGAEHEISLSPLRVRSMESDGWWNLGPNMEETSWSWDQFAGKTTWYSPTCDAQGNPPEVSDGMEIGPGERGGAEYAYAALPAVALDEGFAASGWKTTALGRCALHVDAGGEKGFVVHGKPGEAGDARMRVVAAAGGAALFVEIEDDRKVGPGARWLTDDHLEIWLAPRMPSYMDHCIGERDAPMQWGVRIADGKVFPGAGEPDPAALTVERAEGPGGVTRLKIGLPQKQEGVTVVYSDSDDGKKQERLIATSRLRFGKLPTLGRLRAIPAEAASCRAVNGKLEPAEKPVEPARFADSL